MSKIIVVGGGPSGMMAALNASKSNHEVILLERNGELGRKLLLTGGGRCNITNNRDIEDFFDKVVNNKKFLYSSFYSFTNKDLLSYFEENNLEYNQIIISRNPEWLLSVTAEMCTLKSKYDSKQKKEHGK